MNKKFLKLGLGALLIGSMALTSCEVEEANDNLEDLTEGCTDVHATNYSITALADDGSCEYDNTHLISDGDWKYTTFSSRDFKTRNAVNIKVIKTSTTNNNLNLTLRPYMV